MHKTVRIPIIIFLLLLPLVTLSAQSIIPAPQAKYEPEFVFENCKIFLNDIEVIKEDLLTQPENRKRIL